MAEYDIIQDASETYESIGNSTSTFEIGIDDVNEITNIVTYSKIYHDPKASDSERREAMKK